MTPDELPADMETPVRALAMRLERRALEYNDRLGHYAYIGDDCALDDRAAQALQALLKAYQEQRRALEFYADPISYALTQVSEPRSAVHGDDGKRARAALNQKGDER